MKRQLAEEERILDPETKRRAAEAYAAFRDPPQLPSRPAPIQPTSNSRPPPGLQQPTKSANFLDGLTAALAAAPTWGMNAKALMLQAALQVSRQPPPPATAARNRAHAPALPATPYVSLHPAQKRAPSAAHTAGTAGRAQAAPAANASAGAARTAGTAGKAQAAVPANTPAPRSSPVMLLQALPLNQRPQVAYVPRSSIPRLSRQAVSDVLLGRYLSLLLEGCGVNSCGDSESLKQVLAQAPAVCALACSAAAAHEKAMYLKVASSQAYLALTGQAGVSTATLLEHSPPGPMQEYLQRYCLTKEGLLAKPAWQHAHGVQGRGGPDTELAVTDDRDLFGDRSDSEDDSGSEGGGGSLSPSDPVHPPLPRPTAQLPGQATSPAPHALSATLPLRTGPTQASQGAATHAAHAAHVSTPSHALSLAVAAKPAAAPLKSALKHKPVLKQKVVAGKAPPGILRPIAAPAVPAKPAADLPGQTAEERGQALQRLLQQLGQPDAQWACLKAVHDAWQVGNQAAAHGRYCSNGGGNGSDQHHSGEEEREEGGEEYSGDGRGSEDYSEGGSKGSEGEQPGCATEPPSDTAQEQHDSAAERPETAAMQAELPGAEEGLEAGAGSGREAGAGTGLRLGAEAQAQAQGSGALQPSGASSPHTSPPHACSLHASPPHASLSQASPPLAAASQEGRGAAHVPGAEAQAALGAEAEGGSSACQPPLAAVAPVPAPDTAPMLPGNPIPAPNLAPDTVPLLPGAPAPAPGLAPDTAPMPPPPPPPAAAPDHAIQAAETPGNHVEHQVTEFVLGVLQPLLRAAMLSRAQHDTIVSKSVTKIMSHHGRETSPNFLLRQHEAVRSLVLRTMQHITSRAGKGKG